MAPAVIIDNTPDLDLDVDMPHATIANRRGSAQRTLLLAPPSVSAHPDALANVAEAYDRSSTDIQMLDRLAMGLVSLPPETYDVVLLLTDVDGSRRESYSLLNRDVMEKIVPAMKVGGRLKSQDGSLGGTPGGEHTEAILAGLVKRDGDGMVKPDSAISQTVSLSFGKKKANAAAVPANEVEAVNTGKRGADEISSDLGQSNGQGPIRATPAGVGFVDSDDDFDGAFDDGSGYESEEIEIPSQEELERAERIDPDSLLTEEDRKKPLVIRELTHIAVLGLDDLLTSI
jgi:hypothetical protein